MKQRGDPLDFQELITVDSHREHERLQRNGGELVKSQWLTTIEQMAPYS